MRCGLHVHTFHSGMSTLPFMRRFCRESYSPPEAVYEKLKRRGMNLVTITDHDSIDGSECLRRYPDFFVSEEVTCRMPSGTELHVGAYDITERQHVEIQRRRNDLLSLAAYLEEQRIFCSVQHAFSGLTGHRDRDDFSWLEQLFPAFEVLNGQISAWANKSAAWFAERTRKVALGGSDSHTLAHVGSAYTDVPGARTKSEFLDGLRLGQSLACGQSGGYRKLTAEVFRITLAMWRADRRTWVLLPLAFMIPAATLLNCLQERRFACKWARELRGAPDQDGTLPSRRSPAESREALA